MNYTYSMIFNTDENVILLKDDTNHFGIREIYDLKNLSVEEIKERILPPMDIVISYYKELCNKQDEAN